MCFLTQRFCCLSNILYFIYTSPANYITSQARTVLNHFQLAFHRQIFCFSGFLLSNSIDENQYISQKIYPSQIQMELLYILAGSLLEFREREKKAIRGVSERDETIRQHHTHPLSASLGASRCVSASVYNRHDSLLKRRQVKVLCKLPQCCEKFNSKLVICY